MGLIGRKSVIRVFSTLWSLLQLPPQVPFKILHRWIQHRQTICIRLDSSVQKTLQDDFVKSMTKLMLVSLPWVFVLGCHRAPENHQECSHALGRISLLPRAWGRYLSQARWLGRAPGTRQPNWAQSPGVVISPFFRKESYRALCPWLLKVGSYRGNIFRITSGQGLNLPKMSRSGVCWFDLWVLLGDFLPPP